MEANIAAQRSQPIPEQVVWERANASAKERVSDRSSSREKNLRWNAELLVRSVSGCGSTVPKRQSYNGVICDHGSWEEIRLENDGGVAYIRINEPSKYRGMFPVRQARKPMPL